MGYNMGKWIYLIDALDDYDKDKKKGAFNAFCLAFQAPCLRELTQGEQGKEIEFVFHSIFFDIRENLSHISFHFNRDLSDNILIRGLPAATKRVLQGDCKSCKKKEKVQISNNK